MILSEHALAHHFTSKNQTPMGDSENTKEEILCKICHSPCSEEFPYAHPCKCKGSLKYIHIECLNEWLSLSKNKKCDICNYSFKFEKKFRIGAPKNVPFHYVLLFMLRWMLGILVDIFCLAYAIGKFSLIVFLNSSIGSRYFMESKSAVPVFICGLCLTLVNLFHSHFFKKALSVIGSLRGRIDASRALQGTLDDIPSRSQASFLQVQGEVSPASRSSESDSQLYENINGGIEINLSKILFSRPTLQNLKDDLVLVISLSCVSIIYPVIHGCSRVLRFLVWKIPLNRMCQELATSLLSPSGYSSPARAAYAMLRGVSEVFVFMEKVSLTRFYLESTTLLTLLFTISLILYFLKTRTLYHGFKIGFGLAKSYSLLICTTLHILVSVGFVSHLFFSNAFNKGEPAFPISDFKLSFFMHFCFGVAFTYLSKSIKSKLMKRFRRGLIIKALRDEKVRTLINFCIDTSFGMFLRRCIQNFLFSCFLPAITFTINRIDLGFNLKLAGELGVYLYFKSFMILYRNSSNISQFFVNSFEIIASLYSKVFGADNYLYNKEVDNFDRSCLVWALNSRYADQQYLDWLEDVNRMLKEESKIKSYGKRKASVMPTTHILRTSDSSTADPSRDATPRLPRSPEVERKPDVLEKYRITERRIGKYLGKTHNRKISIFYRPRYFGIFKLLTYLSCFLLVQLIFGATFRISAFMCSKLQSEESKSACFVFCCCLVFSLICCLYELKTASASLLTVIVNRSIVLVYTNILFPFIGSVGLVFLYASWNIFAHFTSIFVIINSLSSISSIIFENVFLASSLQAYSAMYIVRQLCSFLCLKLTIFSSFMIYKRIVKFNSLCIPIIFMLTTTFQIVRLTRLMFSGDLMARIKDYFFLEKTNVIDYNHSDDE